jgi:hypothetical protein
MTGTMAFSCSPGHEPLYTYEVPSLLTFSHRKAVAVVGFELKLNIFGFTK